MGARYYNSALGRFISRDPLGYLGSPINLYTYCADNPVKYTDPSGECPLLIPIIIIIIIVIPGCEWGAGVVHTVDPIGSTPEALLEMYPFMIDNALRQAAENADSQNMKHGGARICAGPLVRIPPQGN